MPIGEARETHLRESEPGSSTAVSVIVLAEQHRPFLRAAIESVLAQDLPRHRYDLFVVRGFVDPEIDAYLSSIGATSIFAPGTSLAAKMATGISSAGGSIVTFLDDDDLFEPTRLRAIVEAFQADPALGLFRNQQNYIRADGRPFRPSLLRGPGVRPWNARTPLLIQGRDREGSLRRITIQRPDFNDSSLAIRRTLAQRAIPYILRLQGRADTLLFYVAACSEYSVQLDPRRLTRYRVHEGNLSLTGGGSREEQIRRLINYAHLAQADYQVTREFVLQNGSPSALRLIDARIAVARLILAARKPSSRRRDFVRLLADVLRLWRAYPVRENLVGVFGSSLFIASPTLARRAYQYHLAIR